MDQLKSSLASVITVLPICIAALFLAGSGVTSAFLRDLGLSPVQFTSSFEDTVLGGFAALLLIGITPLIYAIGGLAVAGSVLFVAVQIVRWRRSKRIRRVQEQRRSAKSDDQSAAYLDNFETLSDRILNGALIMIGLAFAVVTLMPASDKAGRSAAHRFKKNAASGASVVSDIYFKSPATHSIRGVLAACNGSQCAYWIDDHSVIVNMGDVDRVESAPIKPKRSPQKAHDQ